MSCVFLLVDKRWYHGWIPGVTVKNPGKAHMVEKSNPP
jgi:hypothetical protein